MPLPPVLLGKYLIGRTLPPGTVPHPASRDAVSVTAVLRGCLSDTFAMHELRRVLSEELSLHGWAYRTDAEVVGQAGQLVSIGWLRLGYQMGVGEGAGTGSSGITSAPGTDARPYHGVRQPVPGKIPRPTPEPSAPASLVVRPGSGRVAPPPDEATFASDLDGDAMAAALRAAAARGVPFCEVCARGRDT